MTNTDKIRKAYAETVEYRAAKGDDSRWVGFAELSEMAGLARPDFVAAIKAMVRHADVMIEEQINQKTLTGADRAAAVRIGNRDQHMIRIGR